MEVPTGSLTFNLISTYQEKVRLAKDIDTPSSRKVPGAVKFVAFVFDLWIPNVYPKCGSQMWIPSHDRNAPVREDAHAELRSRKDYLPRDFPSPLRSPMDSPFVTRHAA